MFYFRLARELHMTVGQMLKQISSHELTEWLSFLLIESGEYQATSEIETEIDSKEQVEQWHKAFGGRIKRKAK